MSPEHTTLAFQASCAKCGNPWRLRSLPTLFEPLAPAVLALLAIGADLELVADEPCRYCSNRVVHLARPISP